MHLKIKHKLFFTLLAATCTVVLCLLFFLQWSFNRGFLNYVNTLEEKRFERLLHEMELTYGQHNSWGHLRNDQRLWLKLLVLSLPERPLSEKYLQRIEEETRRGGTYSWHALLPGTAESFETRIFLLDTDKNPILGPPEIPQNAKLMPVMHRGSSVGYLGMVPRRVRYTDHQLSFVNEQKLAMAAAASAMLLFSAGLSLPITHRIVKPVNALAASARALAMGQFGTRAPVSSSDELGQFARDFNAMALSLEKNETARRQWLADISHELRTPLSVLRGEIEALQDGIRPTTPRALDGLHQEVLHLSHLVSDLYELSLSDIGALTYRKEGLDLAAVLRQQLDLAAAEFAAKGIALQVEIPEGEALSIWGDHKRIHQLLSNLLDNSFKYTDAGGRLRIALEHNGRRTRLHLHDSAPGVPEASLERLFNRLYRVEGSRSRATGGAGLGLTICKNIVEAHEGTIEALPSPLGGLWVRVDLPLKAGG